MSDPKALPLTGRCSGCGAPDGVAQPHFESVYCPRCAAKNDDYDRAISHLALLLKPAVTAWFQHWIERKMHADVLVEIAENSDELEDLVKVLKSRLSPKSNAANIPHVLEQAA